jgi:hypothetical protein
LPAFHLYIQEEDAAKRGQPMFARVTTVYIRPEMVDKAVKIFEDSIVPAAKKQKGFHSIQWLIDRESGKAIAISIWDTEQDAKANEDNKYYQDQLLKLMVTFQTDPIREGFEVAVETMPPRTSISLQ